MENRFGFAGEQYDPVANLYYLRARFYNPVIGRFLQEDTYYGDVLNLYTYCHNNPVGYVDPSGHVCQNKQTALDILQEQFPDADIEAKYKELRAEYGSARKVREALEAEYGQRLSPDVVNRYSPDSFYTYTQLRKIINQSGLSIKGAGFEAHHLLEKQFARLFNIKVGDIISTPLTPLWHRGVKGEKIVLSGNNIDNLITHELCRIMGIDNSDLAKQSASAKQVWEAHRNIYESIGHEDWANAIYEAYVEQLNIDY